MASEQDISQVKEMIKSLYDLAAVPAWDGDVTDEVAAVFGIMLLETQKCSNAFGWVPRPPGGRASVTWVVRSLGRGLFNAHRGKLSQTCARAVIYKWQRQLDLASMGLAAGRLPKWA
jgi:hypothetical protein